MRLREGQRPQPGSLSPTIKLEVTVFQDAKGQGQAGVDTAIKMVNGDEVPDIINVPYQLVTPENMSQFQQ